MRIPLNNFPIAGLSHHCTTADNGTFDGFTKAEPNNQYDPNAIAIFSKLGKKIGYIPANLTETFRIWGKGKTDFECSIYINIEKNQYGSEYFGSLCVIDKSYKEYIFEDKCFYLHINKNYVNDPFSPSYIYRQAYKVRESGLKNHSDVDVVVSDDPESLPKVIKSQLEKRNIEVIDYEEFNKRIYETIEDNELKGKNVSVVYKLNQLEMKHRLIYEYLIESGAIVSTRYSKKTTDIVVDRAEYGKLKATIQAETEGKRIMFDNDIIRLMGYEIKDKPKKEAPKQVASLKSSRITGQEVSTQNVISRSQASHGPGCMGVLALFILFALSLFCF